MLSPLKRKINYDDSSAASSIIEPQTSSSYVNGFLNGGEKLNNNVENDQKIIKNNDLNELNSKIITKPCCQKFKFNNFFNIKNFELNKITNFDRKHQQFFVHYLSNHCTDLQLSTKLITEFLNAKKILNCVSIPLIDHILKLPSSSTLLGLFLDVQNEISEICAVKILKFCLKNLHDQDEIIEENRGLLHKILRKDYCPSFLIDELKFLSYDEATVIVQFLTACLSKSIFSREENFDQLINFASCLLDAQSTGTFQRWEKFRGEINRLENVITSTILMVDLWIKNEELQRLKKIGGKNKRNDYCIETLLL